MHQLIPYCCICKIEDGVHTSIVRRETQSRRNKEEGVVHFRKQIILVFVRTRDHMPHSLLRNRRQAGRILDVGNLVEHVFGLGRSKFGFEYMLEILGGPHHEFIIIVVLQIGTIGIVVAVRGGGG